MRITHRLIGYDRQTDRMRFRFDIPEPLMPDVKRLVSVPQDDPDAVWSYQLSGAQTRALANLIGAQVDPDQAEFYLEASADSAPAGRAA
jgi:hypothetical protein